MNPLDLPWFVPVVLVVTAGAIAGAHRFAGPTGAARARFVLVIVAIGVVAAATLTPQASAFRGELGSGTCDLTRLRPAGLDAYLRLGETLGNVLLFLPLGVVLALLPPSRTRTWLLGLAVSLPFLIEGLQLALPALDRACQGADVVDNLLGLGLGLALGALAGWVVRRMHPTGHRGPAGSDDPGREPPRSP
jgi:hypothetical protein